MTLTTTSRDLVTIMPYVGWQTALETSLNSLSRPETKQAYGRAVYLVV